MVSYTADPKMYDTLLAGEEVEVSVVKEIHGRVQIKEFISCKLLLQVWAHNGFKVGLR